MQTTSIKLIIYYISFYLLNWLLYILLSSGIIFFHLGLNHHIEVTADWFSFHGYEIIILIKITSFYILLKFLKIRIDPKSSLRKVMAKGFYSFDQKSIIILLFMFISLILMITPHLFAGSHFSISRFFFAVLGLMVFYLSDLFLVYFVEEVYKERFGPTLYIFLSFLGTFFSKKIFIFAEDINFIVFLNYFILFFLKNYNNRNWSLPALFTMIVIAIPYPLFGIDPIWGNDFSLFLAGKNINLLYYLSMIGTSIIFLKYWRKTLPA